MYSYGIIQWVLFFYIYCFLGWIWETCYVSIRKRHFVNRGFLHGPSLPLYGSGAILVLLVTIPVRQNLLLVYVLGMVFATALEYVTGMVMERMFHVRYWDYSNKPFNLNGHICLLCSLAWGIFAIIMIKIIHRPIETLVLLLSVEFVNLLVIIVTIIMAIDMTQSFNEAMNLKELLSKLTSHNVDLIKLQKHLDYVTSKLGEIPKEWEEFKKSRSYLQSVRLLRRNPDAISSHYSEALREIKKIIKKRKEKVRD